MTSQTECCHAFHAHPTKPFWSVCPKCGTLAFSTDASWYNLGLAHGRKQAKDEWLQSVKGPEVDKP